MIQEIYVVDNSDRIRRILSKILERDLEFEYEIRIVKPDWLEIALKNIPELIIINDEAVQGNSAGFCRRIRQNEDNGITPIIVIARNKQRDHEMEVLSNFAQYYLTKPMDREYLYCIITNLARLMYSNRTVSPLTGLPGNVQIYAELKKRVFNRENFTVMYFDLDNFKSYNDVYGFLKGDEVIKFTANTILKYVHADDRAKNFVGHIGGDDFVAILDNFDWEDMCQSIVAEFDMGMLSLLNKVDAQRGYIEAANRKGIIEQFPITAVSIGVVESRNLKTDNILEIGEVGAQVKHAAKTIMGSSYVVNRRDLTL